MRSFLTVLIFLSATVIYAQEEVTTIILVRHAEKQQVAHGDPELTETGLQRTEDLKKTLEHIHIDEIYTSPYKRTVATVRPIAESRGIKIKEYNPSDLEALVKELEGLEGKTILVSGHSNTTPRLINLVLNKEEYDMIDEKDYDNLYIITSFGDNQYKVLELQYGEPSGK